MKKRTMPRQKPNRSKQDYATPAAFITAVLHRLGIESFAHDYAANKRNTKAPSYFSTRDNALIQRWRSFITSTEWGWLNPPFGKITPWAERCAQLKLDGGHIAFLVPASVGSEWFAEHVDGKALVLLLRGRLSFLATGDPYPKDCILCLYGRDIAPGYEVWDWRKQIQKAAA